MLNMLLYIMILIGILTDFISCFLFMRRNRTGGGPSGLPAVTLIICYLLPLLITERAVFTSSYWLDCFVLLCFHVVVIFVIPIFHRKLSTSIGH